MVDLPGGRWLRGAVISLVVAGLVVGVAAVQPPADPPSRIGELDTGEFAPDRVVEEQLPATGEIRPEIGVENASSTVLIDASHGNRFDRAAITPLVEAIGRAGFEVRITDGGDGVDFEGALDESDAVIIIDPTNPYNGDELDALASFVEDGGRLLILGEPDRVAVGVSLFGTTISTQESALTALGNRFDLAFDTRYVYDPRRHDGNYKRPLVEPAREGTTASVGRNLSDVSNVSLYTATTVRSFGDGVPVLVTYDSARLSGSDVQGPQPVAVQDGRVLAVGDATFAGADHYSVVDNEVFLSEVVEFLVTGERIARPAPADDVEDEGPAANGTATNETATEPAGNGSVGDGSG